MVKVHIWLPDTEHVGHTALTVKKEYVSFWPDSSAGKKDLKIKRSHPGTFIQNIHDDILSEGNRNPITIGLKNLDEDRILDYIASLQKSNPRYQLARNNCSHIIAKALIAGANRKASFIPHAGYYSQAGRVLGLGIWTPDQILKFSRELQSA